ncbi:MAG: endolytic transglycosylase MltG [Clostridiales bacterium]|nr:endolytic transglycosylase MltG [Candidatus Equinaster intestinalis]
MDNNQNFDNDFEFDSSLDIFSGKEKSDLKEDDLFFAPLEDRDDDIVKAIKHEEKHSHRRKKKKKNLIRNIIWIVAIVVLSVGLAYGLIEATGEFLGIGGDRGRDIVVEIDKGMSTKAIAERLEDAGALNYPFAFRIYSKIKGYDGKFAYGVYSFNNEKGYEDLADMLMTEGAKAESVKVTIKEMSTVDEMAKVLEESGVCTAEEFKWEVNYGEFKNPFIESLPAEKVHYRFEGYLFPDTYDFYCYDSKACAHLAVQKMLDKMEQEFTEEALQKAEDMGYNIHQMLTMASLVELEAGGQPAEMSNVAQVFYNRLASSEFKTLGSSPTRKYPYGNGRYDTYQCEGLPVGPLCAPSHNAINAALNPNTAQKATFFVTDKSMNFYYTNTLAEHNAIISKLQREKNWVYED